MNSVWSITVQSVNTLAMMPSATGAWKLQVNIATTYERRTSSRVDSTVRQVALNGSLWTSESVGSVQWWNKEVVAIHEVRESTSVVRTRCVKKLLTMLENLHENQQHHRASASASAGVCLPC